MFNVKWSALASFFFLLPSACLASHCPGNVASVHARHLAQYLNLNVVDVSLNQRGPYPFLLDTGAQITSIDPALASELQLKMHGAGEILGVSSHEDVALAQLDDMQVGEQGVPHSLVAIQPLTQLQAADPAVRGVLGGDFLRHFDVLIDQANGLLCLGKSGEMRSHVHGEELTFAPSHAERDAASTEPLIIPVRLSGMAGRPFFLLLDSGANAPFLWRVEEPMRMRSVAVRGNISAGQSAHRAFTITILPAQDMQIGRLLVHQISFATPVLGGNDAAKIGVDGLLPTAQFRRVYIDYNNRFVVLESW
jgi:Aspartyl protease